MLGPWCLELGSLHCAEQNPWELPSCILHFPSLSSAPICPCKHQALVLSHGIPCPRAQRHQNSVSWWVGSKESKNLFALSGMCTLSSLSHPSRPRASDLPFFLLILQFIDLLIPPCVVSHPKLTGATVGVVANLQCCPQDKNLRKLPGYLCGEWVVFITSSLQAKSSSFSEAYKLFLLNLDSLLSPTFYFLFFFFINRSHWTNLSAQFWWTFPSRENVLGIRMGSNCGRRYFKLSADDFTTCTHLTCSEYRIWLEALFNTKFSGISGGGKNTYY